MEHIPDDVRRLLRVVGVLANGPRPGIRCARGTPKRENERGGDVANHAGDDVDEENPAHLAGCALHQAVQHQRHADLHRGRHDEAYVVKRVVILWVQF